MKPIKQELEERGLLHQVSSDDIFEKIDKGGINFYCGFDPSADSLHLGNFIGFMVAVHIMRRGNTYTALTGGATGMIGDPGGKNAERNFLDEAALEKNQKAISKQISHMLEKLKTFTGDSFDYRFVNNKDFYKNMNYLDFLREVGKFITINVMMSKDTVRKRIEDPKQSISYTEFSYMLLQGYDYTKMYKEDDMILQIGGQDQWGNLVTGTEIIRKKYDGTAYALTWPLITDATGRKFGKSEGNAMFLDENKTTPYFIYQYFMNTSDSDVEKYMKMLTLIEVEDINEIVSAHLKEPEKRLGQKRLAREVVSIVHGEEIADICELVTTFLFDTDDKLEMIDNLDNKKQKKFFEQLGAIKYDGENLFETFVKAGLEKSNSSARQTFKSGGMHINEQKIEDMKTDVASLFNGRDFILLRKGKKNYAVVTK